MAPSAKQNTRSKKRKPLLSLDTLSERYTVVIDGVLREMLNPQELSIVDYHRLGKKGARLEAIMEADDPSEEEWAEARQIMDELCRSVLLAPDEVHERLSDTHRLQVTNAFTGLLRGSKLPTAPVGVKRPSTGESGPPA